MPASFRSTTSNTTCAPVWPRRSRGARRRRSLVAAAHLDAGRDVVVSAVSADGRRIGDFVRDLGVVTSIALAMSLLVAYFVTPDPRAFGSPQSNAGIDRPTRSDRLLGALQRAYVPVATARASPSAASPCRSRPRRWSPRLAYVPHLGVQFFPPADRPQFFIDVSAAEGTDIRATERIVARIETLVARQSGVTAYGSFIGAGAPRFYYNVTSEQPKPSYAQIIVDTVDVAAANRLVTELGTQIDAHVSGARIAVKRLEQGPPVGAPIAIRLAGDDPARSPRFARAQAALAAIPGAATSAIRRRSRPRELRRAHRPQPRRRSGRGRPGRSAHVATGLRRRGCHEIRERDRQTPVVVRLPEALRADPSQFGALGVPRQTARPCRSRRWRRWSRRCRRASPPIATGCRR